MKIKQFYLALLVFSFHSTSQTMDPFNSALILSDIMEQVINCPPIVISFAGIGILSLGLYKTAKHGTFMNNALNPDLELTKKLLKDPQYVHDTSYENTPMHIAAEHGQTEKVALLLAHGAPINAQMPGQKVKQPITPLYLAVAGGHIQTARAIVLYYTNVEPRCLSKNALSQAIATGLCLKRLHVHGDIRKKILTLAIYGNSEEQCRILYNNGTDSKQLVTQFGIRCFATIYKNTNNEPDRSLLLEKIIPALVEYRLQTVTDLLNQNDLALLKVNQMLQTTINAVNNINDTENFRVAINQDVLSQFGQTQIAR